MSRPFKKITKQLVKRNQGISPEIAKLILLEVKKAARLQAIKMPIFDMEDIAISIATDSYIGILTSENFDQNQNLDYILRYIRRTVKNKAMTHFTRYNKYLSRFEHIDSFDKLCK